ncbi:hypothetical protein [Klebsiella pneumoniae]|uniref:hypothetical protein n=1 Tax=Klebsiella pneumoniae TaxID=573 RepID=UPI00388F3F02
MQVAEAMRSRGIDDQAIMEMTGLSEDELQRFSGYSILSHPENNRVGNSMPVNAR